MPKWPPAPSNLTKDKDGDPKVTLRNLIRTIYDAPQSPVLNRLLPLETQDSVRLEDREDLLAWFERFETAHRTTTLRPKWPLKPSTHCFSTWTRYSRNRARYRTVQVKDRIRPGQQRKNSTTTIFIVRRSTIQETTSTNSNGNNRPFFDRINFRSS